MKAVVYRSYGPPDVLQLEEVPDPVPADDDILVRVQAAATNAADWRLMRGKPRLLRLAFGLLRPKFKILGADIAGRIEAVGKNVTEFQPGDEVFGDLSESGWGGFAEYVCAKGDMLALKPANLSFVEAAAVPMAAVVALQGLRDAGQIQAEQTVLINGASGGVGTFAVQIAKSYGTEVTAVCSSGKLELMRFLGADHVIDYTRGNFTRMGRYYDVIIAANGYHPISDYKRALRPGGIYVMIGGSIAQMLQAILLGPQISTKGGKKMTYLEHKPGKRDLDVMTELIEAGKVWPVIDRQLPLREVPAALRYLERGHARGKVVITVAPD